MLQADGPALGVAHTTFKAVLSRFCTGVTVITALDGDRPVGFSCQSFSSLSLEPPAVCLCPARTSTSWGGGRRAPGGGGGKIKHAPGGGGGGGGGAPRPHRDR
ncbi:flavin reductase family protein, partial [Nocardia wallacei]|uniref:flavin reductase family protein n=1 Tax=Nocardia wallacei TaxID=480035 RepID=UPI0024589360